MVTRTEQLPEDRPQPGVLSASISTTDSNRWITALALGGLTAATLLSVAGGTPFDLPMPTHAIGLVTPTCGLTRGSTALVGGDAALAWRYNPASVVVVAFGVFGLASGRRVHDQAVARHLGSAHHNSALCPRHRVRRPLDLPAGQRGVRDERPSVVTNRRASSGFPHG